MIHKWEEELTSMRQLRLLVGLVPFKYMLGKLWVSDVLARARRQRLYIQRAWRMWGIT